MKHIIILIISLLLVSCHTIKYVEVPVEVPIETVKTEYINHVHYDSIHIHDSIDRYIKGDTVIITKYKNIDKYHTLIDTVIKTDSVDRPVYINKYIDREVIKYTNKLNWFQKMFMFLGVGLFGVLVSLIIRLYNIKKVCII